MKYEKLFTPVNIGTLTIKNRFAMAPMGPLGLADSEGGFNQRGIDYYTERAKGGTGLIITGVTFVDNEVEEHGMPNCPCSTHNPVHFIRTAREMTERVHAYNAKIFLQMSGGFGRVTIPTNLGEFPPVAPSPIPHRWLDKTCRELTKEEIHSIVKKFGDGAFHAKRAGFDGVQIHAVHEGYLIDQFAIALFNHRTDEYGGCLENRLRFAREIVEEIKDRCGTAFPVTLRYSPKSFIKDFRNGALPGEEYVEAGRDMAESEIAAKFLQDAGYDMLNCDNGTYDAWYWAHPPVYMPENCNLAEVEHIKNFVDIPVVCAGRMTLDAAAEAVAAGKLDGAGFARNFLADPEWFTKVLEDREADIRPCILCHNGCFNMCHYKGVPNDQDLSDSLHLARCAVNAEMMQWDKHYIKKTNEPKTVHIVGGGIGGMEAARVLTLRGHKPIIYEKSGVLGGTFIAASSESYKGKLRDLLTWYRREMEKLGVEVRLNTEVKEIESFGSDPVIIATGSTPRVLKKVPGHEKMLEACEYLLGAPVGEKIAVVGGGLTGCEIAYELALQGKDVTIVEMKDDLVSQKGVCLANSSYLREWFAWKQVPVYLETTLREVKDGSIVCAAKDGSAVEIPCDTVISSAGYIATPLVEEKGHKNVRLVGDCLRVGNLRSVVWRAYEAAMKI